ncbi:hypothetical protein DFH09DRAFT_1369095 [Mycena vulgaris]|nr:hypothetical protein DFH09DRAFT_1369095 [Mycena vulgaris]
MRPPPSSYPMHAPVAPAMGYTPSHSAYFAEKAKRVICMEIASDVPVHVGAVELKLKTRSSRVLFYRIRDFTTIQALMKTNGWMSFCLPPQPVEIIVDYDPNHAKKGAFKQAMFGESVTPLFDDKTNFEIFIKQAIYTQPRKSGGLTFKQTFVHDAPMQAKLLEMEMCLLSFGSGVLSGCHAWMTNFIKIHGKPDFEIPLMRFVQGGLAISEDGSKIFLIEEAIRVIEHGPFHKFMHNRNVKPIPLKDADDATRGRFLAFTQHLQYWMTLKLFFLSNYQGGKGLLTDPQVLSTSELGAIFAEGNISSGFASLEQDHICNEFCTFFQLRIDYQDWPTDSESPLSKSPESPPDRSQRNDGGIEASDGPFLNTLQSDMDISAIS